MQPLPPITHSEREQAFALLFLKQDDTGDDKATQVAQGSLLGDLVEEVTASFVGGVVSGNLYAAAIRLQEAVQSRRQTALPSRDDVERRPSDILLVRHHHKPKLPPAPELKLPHPVEEIAAKQQEIQQLGLVIHSLREEGVEAAQKAALALGAAAVTKKPSFLVEVIWEGAKFVVKFGEAVVDEAFLVGMQSSLKRMYEANNAAAQAHHLDTLNYWGKAWEKGLISWQELVGKSAGADAQLNALLQNSNNVQRYLSELNAAHLQDWTQQGIIWNDSPIIDGVDTHHVC